MLEDRIKLLEEQLEKAENNLRCFENLKPDMIRAEKQKKAIQKKIDKIIEKLERAKRNLHEGE